MMWRALDGGRRDLFEFVDGCVVVRIGVCWYGRDWVGSLGWMVSCRVCLCPSLRFDAIAES